MSNKFGRLYILSGPAGSGKTTLIQRLIHDLPDVVMNISYTTRQPRANEKNGVDYFFVSESQFLDRVSRGEFLEHVELFGSRYGSSLPWVEEKLSQGKKVILVIDTQGAEKIRNKQVPHVSVFVMPPNLDELAKRLDGRRTESEESLKRRLIVAQEEIKKSVDYDYVIVNDNLDEAYKRLKRIVED